MTATLLPHDNEIHLFCRNLSHDATKLTAFEHLLSTTEKERARLLKSDLIRSRFIAGRGELRTILGLYLAVDPAEVRLATRENGKPYVADNAWDLRFNLSHVDDLLMIAVAVGAEVGVDIEKIAADKSVHDMARLAFSKQEQLELLAMPDSQLVEAFYRCWVRKESCLKACGRGFSLPGKSFDVPMNFGAVETPITCNQSFWHIRDIDVPENYCAAVAVEASSPSPPKIVWCDPDK
jgi:4'-phosphopantetheinyl transferase